ncbi:hypothetical protein EB796_020643 [Bugula neritina]|uniref:Uncharacterized protein n=1 Tax=Bugula neritina TaxID=10212 RepID=A0A7J7J5R8_BUGNE|nr:hypothetical protein EB796_020643 [Bugula neritina]
MPSSLPECNYLTNRHLAKHCVQCKEEVRESVTWSRTPAITEEGIVAELSVPCPGYTITDNSSGTIIPQAKRKCNSVDDVGVWDSPYIDKCLTPSFLDFSAKSLSTILELQDSLFNTHVTSQQKADVLEYTESSITTLNMTFADSITITDNDKAWNKTRPLGQLADKLLQVVDQFTSVFSLSLHHHLSSLQLKQGSFRRSLENIGMKVISVVPKDFHGIILPDASDLADLGMTEEPATISFTPNKEFIRKINQLAVDNLMLVTLRLNTFSRLLYDPRYGQHDNINTPLVKIKMYESIDGFLHPSNVPFETTMTLLFSNVS